MKKSIEIGKYVRKKLKDYEGLQELMDTNKITYLNYQLGTDFPYIMLRRTIQSEPTYTKDGCVEDTVNLEILVASGKDYVLGCEIAQQVRECVENMFIDNNEIYVYQCYLQNISEDYIDQCFIQVLQFELKVQ